MIIALDRIGEVNGIKPLRIESGDDSLALFSYMVGGKEKSIRVDLGKLMEATPARASAAERWPLFFLYDDSENLEALKEAMEEFHPLIAAQLRSVLTAR